MEGQDVKRDLAAEMLEHQNAFRNDENQALIQEDPSAKQGDTIVSPTKKKCASEADAGRERKNVEEEKEVPHERKEPLKASKPQNLALKDGHKEVQSDGSQMFLASTSAALLSDEVPLSKFESESKNEDGEFSKNWKRTNEESLKVLVASLDKHCQEELEWRERGPMKYVGKSYATLITSEIHVVKNKIDNSKDIRDPTPVVKKRGKEGEHGHNIMDYEEACQVIYDKILEHREAKFTEAEVRFVAYSVFFRNKILQRGNPPTAGIRLYLHLILKNPLFKDTFLKDKINPDIKYECNKVTPLNVKKREGKAKVVEEEQEEESSGQGSEIRQDESAAVEEMTSMQNVSASAKMIDEEVISSMDPTLSSRSDVKYFVLPIAKGPKDLVGSFY